MTWATSTTSAGSGSENQDGGSWVQQYISSSSSSSSSFSRTWEKPSLPPAPPSTSSSWSSSWIGDSSGNGSSSSSSSSSASAQTAPAPTAGPSTFSDGLSFNLDVGQSPCSCDQIAIAFTGGAPPYQVNAFWYLDQNSSIAYWSQLASKTWNTSLSWDIMAPANSSLLFQLMDANGLTIMTSEPIHIRPNDYSEVGDAWCRTTTAGSKQMMYPAPSDWNSTHNLAWNASDPDNLAPTTTKTETTLWPGSTHGIAASDNSGIYSDEVSDLSHLREVAGALAGVLAGSVLALIIMIFLYMRLRRRHRRLVREFEKYRSVGLPSHQTAGVMTEKPRPQTGNRANHSTVDLMDTNSDYDIAFELITPTADGLRNPFDDPAAAGGAGAAGLLAARRSHLQPRDKNRLSTTSLVSDVPSQGARSTGAHSAFSTEFYHRAQTRTVPLYRNRGSATDSDSASGTLSMSGASSADEGSVQTVVVPITRVSTGSSGTQGFSSSGDSDDARSFSNTSYTEPESWTDGEDLQTTTSRQSDASRRTESSGFSAWGRRLMGRD